MRRILLAAVLVAVAAPTSAETIIWTGEVHVEKWDSDGEFYGYWYVGYGDIPGVRQFTFDGRTYTVDPGRWAWPLFRVTLCCKGSWSSSRGGSRSVYSPTPSTPLWALRRG